MAVRRSQAIQVYKRLGLVLAVAGFCIYAVINLTGPQGIKALFAKWKELQEIEATNARLVSELNNRREKVRILQDSAEAREFEIRKKLQKLRPGEKLYQVPDPEPAAPGQQPN
ncbi:MAG: septum formation initiator family protein [Acidobacteria bacterium]|jgi:cell division protein FtsB|nr:septum formation initiator family protein [Bryobacteraceae bacterium CoA2 C42]MCA2962843.1 septum formation initiator family protein [Acidobacteriaceae bacterium]